MDSDGKVFIDTKYCLWYVTFLNNEITLYSNGFYLGVKVDKESVIGSKFMKEWYFEQKDDNYYSPL